MLNWIPNTIIIQTSIIQW